MEKFTQTLATKTGDVSSGSFSVKREMFLALQDINLHANYCHYTMKATTDNSEKRNGCGCVLINLTYNSIQPGDWANEM